MITYKDLFHVKETKEQLRKTVENAKKIFKARYKNELNRDLYQVVTNSCIKWSKIGGGTGVVLGAATFGLVTYANVATLGVDAAIATGAAFGAITGGIAFLVIVTPAIIAYCYCRYQRSQFQKMEKEVADFKQNAPCTEPISSSIIKAM